MAPWRLFRGCKAPEVCLPDIHELEQDNRRLREELSRCQDHLQALSSLRVVAQQVSSQLRTEVLLADVLSAAVAIVGANAGSLLLLDERKGELEFAVVRGGGGQELVGTRMPANVGVAGWVVQNQRPLIVDDVARDSRFYSEVSEQSGFATASLICVPMVARARVVGVLEALNKSDGQHFSDDDVTLLLAFASQAAVAIENARLYAELREERDRILAVEQDVRNQLARDLHDGPAQLLASLIMRLRLGLRLLDQGNEAARSELASLEPLLERALREVRTMLFDLRPVILEARGLVAAIEEYARRQRDEGFDVRVGVRGEGQRLRPNAERAIFAIIQEAIGNARKHSGASGAVVRLQFGEERLDIEVEDNGAGFDIGAVLDDYSSRGSLGLLNMRERAEAVDATYDIRSTIGHGTTVMLSVPLGRVQPSE